MLQSLRSDHIWACLYRRYRNSPDSMQTQTQHQQPGKLDQPEWNHILQHMNSCNDLFQFRKQVLAYLGFLILAAECMTQVEEQVLSGANPLRQVRNTNKGWCSIQFVWVIIPVSNSVPHLHCKSQGGCEEEERPERTESKLDHQPGDHVELFYSVHQIHHLRQNGKCG